MHRKLRLQALTPLSLLQDDKFLKLGYKIPMPHAIDPKLLEILVCPLTKVPLRYDAAKQELISDQAGLAYPIRDGIPVMLVDEARKI